MNKPRTVVLLSREMQVRCFADADLRRIASVTDLLAAQADEMTDERQLDTMRGAAIIITGWDSRPITKAMLDAAPDLRLMCHSAGSVKSFVTNDFVTREIRVSSARDALAEGVAEFAFGMMLVSMKAVWLYAASTRQGIWAQRAHLDWVCEPNEATVGIVGASHVGRHMIRRCRTLPLKAILVYDPYVSAEDIAALGGERVALEELMRRSDVVSLHTPIGPETHHIINARMLALMKDRAIFINTARGWCVDEAALIVELEKGRIMACLDVTDPEPPDPDSPLYGLPNCILTPHIAGSIKQNVLRQGALVADEIAAYVEGRKLMHEVDLIHHDTLA